MAVAASELLRRHRLTVEEYHRMGGAGVFAHDARVELIEGEVIDMAPIGSRHAAMVRSLMRRLFRGVGQHATVSCQDPILLGNRSEPQPDLCLLRPRNDDYARGHPRPMDVLLVIEVAETTLAYRDIKLPLYARAGIPEVWIIDLATPILQIYRMPAGDRYGEVAEMTARGIIAPAALPAISIDLTGLFASSS